MLSKTLFILLLLPLGVCSQNPYDTSTPEKFVESMGLISQQPKTDNPMPYFYDKKAAIGITKFDEAVEKGLGSFNQFRNTVAEKFPNHTLSNAEGKLKVALDGLSGLNVRSFSFSAMLIGDQLKERQASDYEFISASEIDENGICQLTLKISGAEKTIPLKKTKKGYRMFMEADMLESMYEMTAKLERMEAVFSNANRLLVKGKITEANFQDEMGEVSMNYAKALE